MTYEELSIFTYKELESLTYAELKLPLRELLQKFRDENKPVPVKLYDKLCALCDETNRIVPKESRLSKPQNLAPQVVEVFLTVVSLVQAARFVSDEVRDLIAYLSNYLLLHLLQEVVQESTCTDDSCRNCAPVADFACAGTILGHSVLE